MVALSDPSGCACARLQVLPCSQLILAISPAECVLALCLWLGKPVFLEAAPFYSCHQLIDHFRDHLIECSHGLLRIRCHNAVGDPICFALLEDNSEVYLAQEVSGESVSRPDVFHPDFHHCHITYFVISVRSVLHSCVLYTLPFHLGLQS